MDPSGPDRPNKSALKRAARAVEDLAMQLLSLSEAELAPFPVSAEVREALGLARDLKSHGARRRQVKHLAGLLRRRPDELAALTEVLAEISQRNSRQNREFHELEQLRDRLCDPALFPDAFNEAAKILPTPDLRTIAQLAKRTHASRDRRAFREIFRRLRDARGKSEAP